jgi:hypothetical protein
VRLVLLVADGQAGCAHASAARLFLYAFIYRSNPLPSAAFSAISGPPAAPSHR